jgi:DNA-binding PadR family transcriptional regulator
MDISTIDILFGDDIMAKEQLKTLTEPMYYILLTLSEPQHGYGIMQEVERRTEGRVKIGAGTLYNLLSRFEEENIIVQISEENRRKTYTLTDKGLNILMDEYQRLKQLVSDGSDFLEGRVR